MRTRHPDARGWRRGSSRREEWGDWVSWADWNWPFFVFPLCSFGIEGKLRGRRRQRRMLECRKGTVRCHRKPLRPMTH
jgi:hypothetical protein